MTGKVLMAQLAEWLALVEMYSGECQIVYALTYGTCTAVRQTWTISYEGIESTVKEAKRESQSICCKMLLMMRVDESWTLTHRGRTRVVYFSLVMRRNDRRRRSVQSTRNRTTDFKIPVVVCGFHHSAVVDWHFLHWFKTWHLISLIYIGSRRKGHSHSNERKFLGLCVGEANAFWQMISESRWRFDFVAR